MRSIKSSFLPAIFLVLLAGNMVFAESGPANPCLIIPEIIPPGQSSATGYQPETCIVSNREPRPFTVGFFQEKTGQGARFSIR